MQIRPARHRRSLALLAPVLLSTACRYWASQPGTTGDYDYVTYTRRFGYAAAGMVVNSEFFGEIQGVGTGKGFTLYIPPLGTVQTVMAVGAAAVVTLPIAAIEAAGSGDGSASAEVFAGVYQSVMESTGPEMGCSGFDGVLAKMTHNILSDLSFDLGFTYSVHEDKDYGGDLDYMGLLLGVRAAGDRCSVPRVYLIGGAGWFSFNYDARPDASVPGAYAGVGAELMGASQIAFLGVEYRAHFYFGQDRAGDPVDGGVTQVSVLGGFYW